MSIAACSAATLQVAPGSASLESVIRSRVAPVTIVSNSSSLTVPSIYALRSTAWREADAPDSKVSSAVQSTMPTKCDVDKCWKVPAMKCL